MYLVPEDASATAQFLDFRDGKGSGLNQEVSVPGGAYVEGLGTKRSLTPAEYWTQHNVTAHRKFHSVEESLAYFRWRSEQYIDLLKLMPVHGFDGKVVLDYGCGPGNDLVGFTWYSKVRRLVGMDVSTSSLKEARDRMSLHEMPAELVLISDENVSLPLASESVDHVHCAGVLHHTSEPLAILREFYRVLKPGGTGRIMVYNFNSLFLHLLVGYRKRVLEVRFHGMPLAEVFRVSTDGEECPISRAYRNDEWISLCQEAGLECEHVGNAVFAGELIYLGDRFRAILDPALDELHREFLLALTFDERGLPYYRGKAAGIDGCYSFRKPEKRPAGGIPG